MCGVCRGGPDRGEMCGWCMRKSVGRGRKRGLKEEKKGWDFHRYLQATNGAPLILPDS